VITNAHISYALKFLVTSLHYAMTFYPPIPDGAQSLLLEDIAK
jgi:hypothetical protein